MPEKLWTVLELLRWTQDDFRAHGLRSPRLDAEVLLAHVLAVDRVSLYTGYDRPLEQAELERFRAFVKRRRTGEPVAYIVGEREFWSLPFTVGPSVLVPRPETELIIERALRDAPEARTVLDLGTGSGALAVTLAKELAAAEVFATDLSAEALAVAAHNAERNGVAARVRFAQGDLFAPVGDRRFDLVVSNPPYIPAGTELPREVAAHEPALALFAGPDGLAVIRRLAEQVPAHLVPGGLVLVEVGVETAEAAAALFASQLTEVTVHKDLAGLPRVIAARARREEKISEEARKPGRGEDL